MHDERENSKSHAPRVGGLSRLVLTRGDKTFQYEFEEDETDEKYGILLGLLDMYHACATRDGDTLRVMVVGQAPWLWGRA